MIHDTFKHGIFILINFLRTKRVTLIKKVQYAKQNFQDHTNNPLLVVLQEPHRLQKLHIFCPYECHAGSSLCIFLRRVLEHRANGCMEDWNETLSYCICWTIPVWSEIHDSVVLDIILCNGEWISVKIIPKEEFVRIFPLAQSNKAHISPVWFWCLLLSSLLSVQTKKVNIE